MATSVAFFVGDSTEWIPAVPDTMATVTPGSWDDESAGYGPLVRRHAAKQPQHDQQVVLIWRVLPPALPVRR